MKDYSELKALAEKATPGPWRLAFEEGSIGPVTFVDASNEDRVCDNERYYPQAVTPDNQAFIVAACNEILSLIAENEALREALTSLENDPHNIFSLASEARLRRVRIAYEGK